MKRREFKGEITVFLCLIFMLLLTFIGAVMQSASIHITKSMKRTDTRLALENVFAEYHTGLLEQYDIFARADARTELMIRLDFYGAGDMEHEIREIQYLTDSGGLPFYAQAVQAMGGKAGEAKEIPQTSWEEEAREAAGELDGMLTEEGMTLPSEGNPLENVKRLQASSLLSLILPESETPSGRSAALENLPTHRVLRTGTKDYRAASRGGAAQKLLFMTYLAEHFPDHASCAKETGSETGSDVLLYEAEYLLEGRRTDQENLEAVFKKILTIRTGVNYAYLLTDQEKQAEAGTMALSLTSLFLVPEASEVVKQVLLFAWAYGEGIEDLRALADGKRVPLVKTRETWQLSLQNLLKLGTDEEIRSARGDSEGMSYSDFIKVFLMAEDTDDLSMRALDLIELHLKIPVDECVTAVRIKSVCRMQRNIRDTFHTEYYYQ